MVDLENLEGNLKTESLEIPVIIEKEKELDFLYKKQRKKEVHGFLKDIEITKEKYVLLGFILNSILCMLSLLFDLSMYRLNSQFLFNWNYDTLGFISGAVLGVGFAFIKLDIEKKRLTMVQTLLLGASINMGLQIAFIGLIDDWLIFLSYGVSGFITIELFLIFLTLFLDFSSILERGRVLAFIIIEGIITILIISVIAQIGVHKGYGLFFLAYLIFPILTIGFTHSNKKKLEKPASRELGYEEKHINKTLFIYMIFAFLFSITLGLASPISEIELLLGRVDVQADFNLDIIVIFGVLASLMTGVAIDIGYLFDFFGRRFTISNLLLIIAAANFFNLITPADLYIQEILIVSLYIALIVSLTLLIGDVTKRKNYGKILCIVFVVSMAGIILGGSIQEIISQATENQTNADLLIVSIEYLTSVFCLVIVVSIKETLPHKEKEWFESLFHLYIIHKSGILIFEHEFMHEENKIESDLVSGGIIGMAAILGEIVKGKERLRTIDHGDKKLMFKYSQTKDVIFVLLIREDLFILRSKLDDFSKDFIEQYKDEVINFEYCDINKWKNVSKLIDKYFERKYFDISHPRWKKN